jgi:hypothetical protein
MASESIHNPKQRSLEMLLSSSECYKVAVAYSLSAPVLAGILLSPSLDTNISDSAAVLSQNVAMANILTSAVATIRSLGENAFLAAFIVAFLQATVALFQYRTNPTGELIFPEVNK